eukprot:SAG31_NODE_2050_length_6560_cov_2.712119_8_plen_221_part_00
MVESIAAWERLEDEVGHSVGWQQGGNLALCGAGDAKKAAAQAAWVAAAKRVCPGLRTEVVGPAMLAELLPGLATDRYSGGLWTANDGTVDPDKATAAFAAAAAANGAEFLLGAGVARLATCSNAERVTGVELDSGTVLAAGAVVVAAAGWSDELLRKSQLARGADRSYRMALPTLRLHATAGRTERVEADGFPTIGVVSALLAVLPVDNQSLLYHHICDH